MTVSLSMFAGAGAQLSDDNGAPLAGGLVYTYTAGTTTPVVTYQTSSGSGGASNSNPIVLDSAGRVPYQIWLTDGAIYKFVLKTSGGSTVRTEDNVYGAQLSNVLSTFAASSGSSLVGFVQTGSYVVKTMQDKARENITPADFGAVVDGLTDDTASWNSWVAAVGNKYIPRGYYMISGDVNYYSTGTFVNTINTNHSAGLHALKSLDAGNANTAFGYEAGAALIDGSQNTAVGKSALSAMEEGNNNTAIGFGALRYANDINCIQNTIIGAFCGEQITSGHSNTAAGHNTLKTLTTGDLNSAFGQGALAYTTTGSYNSAFGYHSLLYYNGDYGTAVGTEALMNCTTGAGNVGIGRGALKQVTTQTLNTAVGHLAGTSCSGGNNVFVGESAAWLTTTGSDNTVVGMNALVSNTTGEHNVAIGRGALYSNNSSRNIAVGRYAAISATSDENTAIGHGCLYDCTSGRVNTALGKNALTGLVTYNNCTGVGASTAVTGSNQVQLGDSSTTTYAYGAVQNRSDSRDKAEIIDTVLGLSFINALRPVDFKWDLRSDYYTESQVPSGKVTPAGEVIMNTVRTPVARDGSKKKSRYHHGLIAQEVKSACVAAGVDFGGYQDHSISGGDDVLSIGYEELIAPLIKAVQQLSAEIEILKAGATP